MKKAKQILALLLVCFMVFGLAACGGGSDSGSAPAATEEGAEAGTEAEAPAGEQTLRVTWWGNTNRDLLYQQINELFMAENPGVTIITESPGWNDYWPAVSTAYASGNAPDVVQFQSGKVGEYVPMGVLAPLDSYVDDGTINLEGWNQDLVDTGYFADNFYMVSLGITAQTVYINETFLTELGIELWPEDEDISWDDFAQFMLDVQAKLPEGAYAMQDVYRNNDLVWIWMRQHTPAGVEWTDADGNFAPSEEAVKAWFDYANDLREAGAIAPITLSFEWENMAWEEGPFVNREVAFYFANANQIMTYQNATEDKLVMRKVPTAPNADNAHGDLLISSAFAISESSQQKELAAKYIDFFVNNEEAQKVFNFELGVPGSLAIQDMLVAGADPANIMANDFVNLVSKDVLPFVPMQPGVTAVVDEIATAAQEVGTGSITTDDAAKKVLSSADALIQANK